MSNKWNIVFFWTLVLMATVYNGYGQAGESGEPDSTVIAAPREILPAGHGDTALAKDSLAGEWTVLQWKNSREFRYMNYLDSLLRTRKDLRNDTVSIDAATGRVNRHTRPAGGSSGMNLFLNSLPVRIFFWILAVIFIGYIFYTVLFKKGVFSRKRMARTAEPEDGSPHELNEISEYDDLIREVENKKEFGLATRYLFLKTLKVLSERGYIHFAPERTNRDYLEEMKSNRFLQEFEKLTRNYEYIWYGKFSVGEERYRHLKEAFDLFDKKI
jgi:hypothetical protein